MKIKVAVRGVMIDSSTKEQSSSQVLTRIKARQPAGDSGFVRGMIWGIAISLLIWTLLTLAAIKWWL